jgi:nitric oxide reductase NorD protein
LSEEANNDGVERLGLLASALSRRPLQVAPAKAGEPAWTDGKVVYLDVHRSAREQVESLAVQASLLAAGSLERDIVHGLARRPRLTRRYLAVEGHRALAALEQLLPPAVRSLIRSDVVAGSDSPVASLSAARSRRAIVDPPASFGTISAHRLLASLRRAERSQAQPHAARARRNQVLVELAEDATADENTQDPFSSPVGGGGVIGRWLAKLLSPVRQLRGGGSPGADAPTHWTRTGRRGASRAVLSTATTEGVNQSPAEHRDQGTKYPEWDVHARRYREDWCTVHEVETKPKEDAARFRVADRAGLRRSLARLALGIDRHHRQAQGDDIDIDAVIEARVDMLAGSASDEGVFIDSVRRRRDLSVLLLLDVSGSAAEPAANGTTVHEQQRAAAATLMLALHELGDRVALHAYHSRGRSAVNLMPVKRFGEHPSALVLQRLSSLEPGAYSRLGAAIRHGTTVLQDHGGTPRQLLVVLSDGLAYDHGYEPAYGAADTRRALGEARRDGVGCLCLSVGSSTDAETLRRVFGSSAHATLPEPEQLSHVIGPLFRSAIRSADVRRRAS